MTVPAEMSALLQVNEGYAKKLILVSLNKNTATEFVKFTPFDNKNACYEVTIRNFDGRQKTTFISLNRDSENTPEWNHWAATESLDECRKEFIR